MNGDGGDACLLIAEEFISPISHPISRSPLHFFAYGLVVATAASSDDDLALM